MSFFAKNAYMGVQSITEVAAMVTKGHTRMLLKGVPILKDMTAWGSKIKANDLADNDPVSQKLLLMMMEGQGVEIR